MKKTRHLMDLLLTVAFLTAIGFLAQAITQKVKPVPATLACTAPQSRDQDDMCVWVHPADASQSTIITSDKKAKKLFVYDLEGKVIQTIPARHPGNVDVRY